MPSRLVSVPLRFLLVPSSRILACSVHPRMSMSTVATAYPWGCTASIDPNSQKVEIERLVGYKDATAEAIRRVDGQLKQLDLTKSPDWMEYIEVTENRIQDEGGAGAYDTMRCDMLVKPDSKGSKWNIWGEEFHLNRLRNSFRFLLHENGSDSSARVSENAIRMAMEDTHSILKRLLSEAENAEIFQESQSKASHQQLEDILVQPVRLSLLWSLSKTTLSHVVVRGHACSSTKPVFIHRPSKPITVTIAAVGHNTTAMSVDESMPTRLSDPQHKVASWTRLRQKMENPETYMPEGVSEVLMVRQRKPDGALEVLEGLSSNFFVIYKDGTIRTPADGVLHGYVRHLVLDCAKACGLVVDTERPILMNDCTEGLWKEAFITSSSRLIFPICKILVHTADKKDFTEFWSDAVLNDTSQDSTQHDKQKWRQLLDEILNRAGYPVL